MLVTLAFLSKGHSRRVLTTALALLDASSLTGTVSHMHLRPYLHLSGKSPSLWGHTVNLAGVSIAEGCLLTVLLTHESKAPIVQIGESHYISVSIRPDGQS